MKDIGSRIGWLFIATALGMVFVLDCGACDSTGSPDLDGSKERAIQLAREWDGPCADMSVLLATTAGSPSEHTCPNKRHHMHVQVASKPSNEEFGALVFCECERDAAAATPDAGAK